ncbi:MAG: type I restriction enzyme HsdR N-terminal domain-containing protein [Phycisphaerae bacterium]|nr:type I restriction enzyme HsdR N-terminal domain-containing protein [Tepidisphaeraceae bacterium]
MVSKKTTERITAAAKRLLPILEQQRTRDVSEADTVTLVKDLLADIFGFDKYAELTGEHAIRGTFCDLAVKLDDKVVELIEVKAIGIELNDRHVKQAIDYAANLGIEWVILTNAISWRLYHVIFAKPIDKQLISEVDLTQVDYRKEGEVARLYPFTKEGFKKGLHVDLKDRQDATSRFLIAALLTQNDAVVGAIRRELRRVVEVNVSEDEILKVLQSEVIKRDALEGPSADDAAKRINRSEAKKLRSVERPVPENVDIPAPSGPAVSDVSANPS